MPSLTSIIIAIHDTIETYNGLIFASIPSERVKGAWITRVCGICVAFNGATVRVVPVARNSLIFVAACWIIGVTQYSLTICASSNHVKRNVAIFRHTGTSDGYTHIIYSDYAQTSMLYST